jgi:hypothetical protein
LVNHIHQAAQVRIRLGQNVSKSSPYILYKSRPGGGWTACSLALRVLYTTSSQSSLASSQSRVKLLPCFREQQLAIS